MNIHARIYLQRDLFKSIDSLVGNEGPFISIQHVNTLVCHHQSLEHWKSRETMGLFFNQIAAHSWPWCDGCLWLWINFSIWGDMCLHGYQYLIAARDRNHSDRQWMEFINIVALSRRTFEFAMISQNFNEKVNDCIKSSHEKFSSPRLCTLYPRYNWILSC